MTKEKFVGMMQMTSANKNVLESVDVVWEKRYVRADTTNKNWADTALVRRRNDSVFQRELLCHWTITYSVLFSFVKWYTLSFYG